MCVCVFVVVFFVVVVLFCFFFFVVEGWADRTLYNTRPPLYMFLPHVLSLTSTQIEFYYPFYFNFFIFVKFWQDVNQ